MTYNKLYYNSVTFDGVESSFGPNFICPKCGERFKDDKTTSAITSVVKDSQKRVFTCPKCKATIELYVGVVRNKDGREQIQISVKPIDVDQMEKELDETNLQR